MRTRTRRIFLLVAGVVAGACCCAPRLGAADHANNAAPAWLDQVTLNGFVATSYSFNFNRPASGLNQFRVFDFDDNTFKLDEFELVAQKTAVRPRDSGFRVDLTLGSSVPRVTAAAGLFRDESGVAADIDLHQAFASYIAPLGAGLRFDVGKFITAAGYEVIDGYDGWNDNATRSILFGYAIPFTHVGVRTGYTFSPQVTATFMVVNGWDLARDNNRSKTLGGSLTLTPRPRLTIIATGFAGPERSGDDSHSRNLLDLVTIVKPTDRLTLGANLDWAMEDDAVGSNHDGRWSGAAGYARVTFPGNFALSLRGEFFDDPDGLRTGVSQKLHEFTVTTEARLTPHFLLRGDVRVDQSNLTLFESSGALRRTQPTAMVEAIYSF